MDTGPVEVCGYGIGLALIPPFQMGRMGDEGPAPDALILAHPGSDRMRNLMIRPGRNAATKTPPTKVWKGDPGRGVWAYETGTDGTTLMLGADMKDLAEVAKWSTESPDSHWSIQTRAYRLSWPTGFRLTSTQPDAPWSFELHGDEDSLIFLRGPLAGPEQIPAPQRMVGPGQKMVDQGSLGSTIWIELEYVHDGKPWRQRHYYGVLDEKRIVLITGQAPKSRFGDLARACDSIAKSLVRR